MPGLPIPEDWDGSDWTCVQLQWPNSVKWLSILAGLLSTMHRGRTWDEDTGLITDVQSIGWEIWDRSVPFIACGEDTTPPDDGGEDGSNGGVGFGGACPIDFEELFGMSLCGYNPNAFKIENGTLYVRDFCGEWVSIGPISGPSPEPGYTPPPDIDTEVTGIYPCGMAVAVADKLVELASYIWDEADSDWPILIVRNAQNAVGLDLNNLQTQNAANQALLMKGVITASYGAINLDKTTVIPTTFADYLACQLLPLMGSDGTVDADDLYDAVKTILGGYSFASLPFNNTFIRNFWYYIRGAIGRGNMADLAVGGQYIDAGDCLCPGEAGAGTGVTASGWYLSEYIVNEDFIAPDPPTYPDYGYAWGKQVLQHDIYGLAAQIDTVTGAMDFAKRTNAPAPAYMGAHDKYMTDSNSDHWNMDVAGIKAAIFDQSILTELQAIGELSGWYQVNPTSGEGSTNPAAPVATKGQTALMSFTVYDSSAGSVNLKLRWLHNINSPSHS